LPVHAASVQKDFCIEDQQYLRTAFLGRN